MAEEVRTEAYGSGLLLYLTRSKVMPLPDCIPGTLAELLKWNHPDPFVRYSTDFFDGKHQVVVSPGFMQFCLCLKSCLVML